MTDECYCQFLYDSEPFSIASLPGREGDRAGGRIAFEDLRDDRMAHRLRPGAARRSCGAMTKLQSHSTSNPTSISQKAAVEALRGPQESVRHHAGGVPQAPRFRGAAAARRSRACSAPSRRARSTRIPNVGVALGKNGIANTLQFSERLLAEAHVAVVPGEAFGTDQHIRISYATSMKELERGLDRIHRFIAELV